MPRASNQRWVVQRISYALRNSSKMATNLRSRPASLFLPLDELHFGGVSYLVQHRGVFQSLTF